MQNVMSATLGLSEKAVEKRFEAQKTERAATLREEKVRAAGRQALGFIKSREEVGMFNLAFGKLYAKYDGDAKKTLNGLRKIYQKTHPRQFRNTKSTSFQGSRRTAKQPKTREQSGRRNWSDFINR